MTMIKPQRIIFQAATERPCSDELLWLSFKNGDRLAFTVLYKRYWRWLCEVVGSICADKALVKDCVQDLFAELWRNRQGLSVPISVKAYLLRSGQRKILKQLKKKRSVFCQGLVENLPDRERVTSIENKRIERELVEEQKRDLYTVVNTLTRRQREAVYLRFYADLSYAEIAGKMSISTDSIYNLISKAIQHMQEQVQRCPLPTL